MDARDVIRGQGRALLDDVEAARRMLDAFHPRVGAIDGMRPFFEGRLGDIKLRTAGVLDTVRDEGPAIGDLWKALGRQQRRMRRTGLQLLAYLEGGLLRGLSDGASDAMTIWDVADALMSELGTATQIAWQRFTLPGAEEFIDTETEIIRLSFSSLGEWDLPIAIHEFGHFAAPRIRAEGFGISPFAMIRDATSECHRSHLEELFGDAFAIHVGGPAYACSSIVMRFNPMAAEATEATDTHPSHSERVALMLGVMESAPQGSDPDWTWVTAALRTAWHQGMNHVGKSSEIPDERRSELDSIRCRITDEVLSHIPASRYDGWGRVVRGAAVLRDSPGCRPEASLDASMRDVLNMAWLARLRSPGRVAMLERFLHSSVRHVAAAIKGATTLAGKDG